MKIKIQSINNIKIIPENDSDLAIVAHWEDKYFLCELGSCEENENIEENDEINDEEPNKTIKVIWGELQTLEEIKKINITNTKR